MRAIWLKSAALAAALWLMPGPAGVPAFAQSDTSRAEANADDVLSATEDGAMLRDPEALPSRDPSSDQDSAPDVAGTHSPADQPAEPDARTDAAAPPPEPTLAIDIDLGAQRMRVTEAGGKTYSWPVSSGAYGYPTPTGTFRPVWTSKMWYSRQYEYAPMPNSIFFHGGTAIHATTSVGMLGRPASHGCVRLSPSNAATLYKMVGNHGKERTRIVVHGTPNYSSTPVARRMDRDRRYAYAYSYFRAPSGTYYYPGDPPPQYYYQPRRRRYAAPQGFYGNYYGKQRRYVVRQYRPLQGYGYSY